MSSRRAPGRGRLLAAASLAALLTAVLLAGGCAARRNYDHGEDAKRAGQWEEAVRSYSRAAELAPDKPLYKIALERTKLTASQEFFKKGQEYANTGLLEEAAIYFNKAIMFDPSNQYAIDELGKVMESIEERRAEMAQEKSELEIMKEEATVAAPPRLHPLSNAKISFSYKDTSIKTIYEQLGKVGGINIIFDKQIQDQDFSIDVSDVTFEEILNILALANGHFIKVIDETTLIIVPDNQAKRKEYEDQVIKTFYLSSADIKDVQTLLRTILAKTRTIAINPELNAITIMDTPSQVALASRIIESNDKNKSEVVIDIELLEVNRKRLQTLGLELSSYTIGQALEGAEDGLRLNQLRYINSTDWILTLPSIIYNFLKTDSDTKLIAKPQLRVAEGEKAQIHIGDKVPIPTTTFNFTQTDQSGNVIPVTSYTYQNVGIQIEVTPRVHHNREVSLELKVEVSSLGAVTTSGQPTIGSREITTVIRLKDGETNLLAGLIKEDYSDSVSGVPGATDIPFFNRFLSKSQTSTSITDIVLTITPHIVRIPNITREDLESIYVGMPEKELFRAELTDLYGGEEPEEGETEEASAESEEERKREEKQRSGGTAGQTETEAGETAAGAPDEGLGGEEPVGGWEDEETDWTTGEGEDPFGGGGGAAGEGGTEAEGEGEGQGQEQEEGEGGDSGEGAPPPSPITVSLVPGSVEATAGSVFSVAVNIADAHNVGHVPFYILYNPQVLEFAGAAEGGFLNADGTATSFRATAADGRVLVGLSRLGRGPGAEGAGTLATFQFRATAAGSSALSFSNNSVKDPSTRNLPSVWIPGQVSVR